MNTERVLQSFLDTYVDAWMRETQPEWRNVRWYVDGEEIVLVKDANRARVSLSKCFTYDKGQALQALVGDIRRTLRDWLTPHERWLAEPQQKLPKGWRLFGRRS